MSCLRDVHLIRDTPARLLTTPLYRLPLSSKPLKSLAESLRNRHGAHTPPQPSPARQGRLTRATGRPSRTWGVPWLVNPTSRAGKTKGAADYWGRGDVPVLF